MKHLLRAASALCTALALTMLVGGGAAAAELNHHSPPGQAPSGTDRLHTGQILRGGQYLSSANGLYELRVQMDGNLVLYRIGARMRPSAVWSTRTWGNRGVFLGNQGDGNLVLYRSRSVGGPVPLWHSVTAGRGPSVLIMQNDGNVVLVASGNRPVWSLGTQSPVQPERCGGALIDGQIPLFAPVTPEPPVLDGQRPVGWLHGMGRVASSYAPCGARMTVVIDRWKCGRFGCGWSPRAVSRPVAVNTRGYTFNGVKTTCESGIHRYRTRVQVTHHVISDGAPFVVRNAESREFVADCRGIGSA